MTTCTKSQYCNDFLLIQYTTEEMRDNLFSTGKETVILYLL
jgi:hypothetical protein